MARAILLTFKDNNAAEAFVKKVWAAQQVEGVWNDDKIGLLVAAHARIRWMIAQPTRACTCTILPNTGKGKFNTTYEKWTKTERFGWLVHRKCNKPNFFVVRNFIRNLHVGYNNLLPELREVSDETEGNASSRVSINADEDATNSTGDANGNDVAGSATVDGSDHVQAGPGTEMAVALVEPAAGHTDLPSGA